MIIIASVVNPIPPRAAKVRGYFSPSSTKRSAAQTGKTSTRRWRARPEIKTPLDGLGARFTGSSSSGVLRIYHNPRASTRVSRSSLLSAQSAAACAPFHLRSISLFYTSRRPGRRSHHSALCTNHSSPIFTGGFPASTRPQCTMESSSGSVAPTMRYGMLDVTTTGDSFVPLGCDAS